MRPNPHTVFGFMSISEEFTRELAHLVWLLVYRPAHVDDQKLALRGLLSAAKEDGQHVVHTEVAAAVATGVKVKPLPDELPWLSELSTRMASHSVRMIEAHAGAKANELLGLARALSTQGGRDDQGQAFDTQIVALALSTIAVHLGRDGFVRTPTPPHGMLAVGIRPARTPASGTMAVADAVTEPGTGAAGLSASALSTQALGPNEKPKMVEQGFMPPGMADDLVIRLRGEIAPEHAAALLDEVSRLIEDASRQGEWATVLELAMKVLDREATVTNPDVKRAFAIQMKRLNKSGVLRGVAQLLPKRRDLREQAQSFLVRQGDAAADILIELLVAAESSSDRRAYRDAVRMCPSAVEPLVQLLRDHRWFVVRNAAELLGEMNAAEADQELINTLRHRDARVRQAATLALIKLGTPRAVHTIIRALGDTDVQIRLKAASGLGRANNPRAVAALLAALDGEHDESVQHAILAALGHYPAAESVARLVEESKPGPLLKRRPAGRRLAAVQALGDAATHEARAALRGLVKDRDRAVRELAEKLLREQAQEAGAHL